MKLKKILIPFVCLLHQSFALAGVFDYLSCVIANSSPIICAGDGPSDPPIAPSPPTSNEVGTSSSSGKKDENNSYFKMYGQDNNQCCFGKVDQRQGLAYIESACSEKPIRNADAISSPFAIDCPYPSSNLLQFYKNLPEYEKKLQAKLSSSTVSCAGFVEKSLYFYDNFQCGPDTSHFSYWQSQTTSFNEIRSPKNTEVGSIHCYPKESYSSDGPNYELVDENHPVCRFPLMAGRLGDRSGLGENVTVDTFIGNTHPEEQKVHKSGDTVPSENSNSSKVRDQ